jgi:hypothetical protein
MFIPLSWHLFSGAYGIIIHHPYSGVNSFRKVFWKYFSLTGEGVGGMAGRPVKFKTAKEMENKIADYFATITITYPVFDTVPDEVDEDGKITKFKQVPRLNNAGTQVMQTDYLERPTVLGMCRHLEITRETLCQYEKQEEFSDTIKRAKARIEEYLEIQLYRKDQVTGIIFNLKHNFGWKDNQGIELTGKDGGPIRTETKTDLSKLTVEELKQLEGILQKAASDT